MYENTTRESARSGLLMKLFTISRPKGEDIVLLEPGNKDGCTEKWPDRNWNIKAIGEVHTDAAGNEQMISPTLFPLFDLLFLFPVSQIQQT